MLKNAYLLAKIDADKAENERKFAKNWQLPYVAMDEAASASLNISNLAEKNAPAFATVQEITTESCYLRNKRIYMNLHRNPQAKVSFFITKVNDMQP